LQAQFYQMGKHDILAPGNSYHVFNRTNNKDRMFIDQDNYLHFIKLMKKYLVEVCEINAYALIPNHFHMLISIDPNYDGNINQNFSNFFNSYAKGFNKWHKRHGSLFENPYNRSRITSEDHFRRIVAYIHWNPQKHKLVECFKDYKYSSFSSYLSDEKDWISCEKFNQYFKSKYDLLDYHSDFIDNYDGSL